MKKVTRKPTTALYPVPAILASCGTGSEANIITLAWTGTLCSKPPLVGIGVRPNRHSHGLIQAQGEFVINIPSAEQLQWVDHCGIASGRDEDKWATCGFTPLAGTEVEVPLIAECPVNLECRLTETLSLGSHDLFIGEIVAIQMSTDMLDEAGHLDYDKADPLTYMGGEYRRVGKLLAKHGFTTRKS